MQLILLTITVILSIVLYKMLSGRAASFPFVRTTRMVITDDGQSYQTTEAEHGMLTIDRNVVIIDGQEYSLKGKETNAAEAYLTIQEGKLVSVSIKHLKGEKIFFIDPEHSLYAAPYQKQVGNEQRALLSV